MIFIHILERSAKQIETGMYLWKVVVFVYRQIYRYLQCVRSFWVGTQYTLIDSA